MKLIIKLMIVCCLLIGTGVVSANNSVKKTHHKITSKITDQELEFNIVYPWGYDVNKSYPVLYTTSGGTRLDSLIYQTDWLSHVSMGPMPQVVIVTLPQIPVESNLHPKDVAASGLANEVLLKVIKTEIKPYVNLKISSQGFELLEGYSSNGNFPLFVYQSSPEAFNGYLVHSPALELDRTGLVDKLSQLVPNQQHLTRDLYLSLGPFESNRPLFNKIKSNPNLDITGVNLEDLSQLNFLAVANVSLVKAVGWMFADMKPNSADFAKTGIDGVKDYYEKLSAKYNKVMDATNTLIELAFLYAKENEAQRALHTIDEVIASAPKNVFYMTRKGLIQKQLGLESASKMTFESALEVANQANNLDAVQFINGQLSKLN